MIFIFNYTRLAGEVNGCGDVTLRLKSIFLGILNGKLGSAYLLWGLCADWCKPFAIVTVVAGFLAFCYNRTIWN